MSRRAKLFPLVLFFAMLGLFAVGQQLMWMPAHPLEFRLVEFRPEDSTTALNPDVPMGTVVVDVTNHASTAIILGTVDLVDLPLDELEGMLTGDPFASPHVIFGMQSPLGQIPQDITVPEGGTTRIELHKVWLRCWRETTEHNVVYFWQTRPRRRWESLVHWLGDHLPYSEPIRQLIPRQGCLAVPLK